MGYRVVITIDAENDLDRHLKNLAEVKKNNQAVRNVIEDFEKTKLVLEQVAESLPLCQNPRLASQGYKRINYLRHDYFMMFRVVDELVIVDNIFHFLEDYENKMR